jgi:transcriptional regulator with XRE-family HTH domain
MKNPATSAPGSGPTIAPETALLAFRRKREAAGHSQIGLARLLGKSTAYVAHIENGRLNPSPSVRAELAALIGESAEVLFADFRTTKEEENAALGQRIVELYDAGASDAAIANLVEIGRGKAYSRRHAAGRTGRPKSSVRRLADLAASAG